jgi:hypothetical protein
MPVLSEEFNGGRTAKSNQGGIETEGTLAVLAVRLDGKIEPRWD